jgi:hypothetical protein
MFSGQIKAQSRELPPAARRFGMPKQRSDPCFELTECERFGQIVVCARLQSASAVMQPVLCAQGEYREEHPIAPYVVQQVQPTAVRRTEIEDHELERSALNERHGRFSSARDLHLIAAGRESRADSPTQHRFMFDQQYLQ